MVAGGLLAAALVAVVLLRLAVHPIGRLVVLALAVGLAAGLAWTLTRPAAYDRTRVGTGTRVLTRPAGAGHGPCVSCGAEGPTVAGGERRQYVREAVALGVPLVVLDRGENVYCADCAADDAAVRGADDPTPGWTDADPTTNVDSTTDADPEADAEPESTVDIDSSRGW